MGTLNKHWKLSEETKKRMSEAHKGISKPWAGIYPRNEKHLELLKRARSFIKYPPSKKIINNCKICNKEFQVYPYEKNNHIFCSQNCRGIWVGKNHLGNKCYFWKGGITSFNLLERTLAKYKKWRKSVFERDNYTCQHCGDNKGGNLEADHIKQFAFYPKLRFDINNGRTLCINCHKKTDTWGYPKNYINQLLT